MYRIRKKGRKNQKPVSERIDSAYEADRTKTRSAINTNESSSKITPSIVKINTQEIKEQTPGLTASERRARHSDQYIQDNVNPRIKLLLEKKT
jgi:hypothetical protein